MRVALGANRACSAPCRRHIAEARSVPIPAKPSIIRIGKHWPEYQGAKNWDGLLDPLDDTLRSEILRYGGFAQAAYSSFDFDPSSPSYATCRFPKHSLLHNSGLPCTGYRVTRHLHATSGAGLPCWADYVCPPWLSQRSSWIGYAAVCMDEDEVARLGRRDIVICYRGTATALEWIEILRATLTQLPCAAAMPSSRREIEPMVERGFWSLFTSSCRSCHSLRDEVREEVRRLIQTYGGSGKPLSLTVTGHSLGAALAVLTAYDVTSELGDAAPMVTVVSFGGPRVGNAMFRQRLEERGSKVLRIVNTEDIVTKVPGFVVDREVGKEEGVMAGWLIAKNHGWFYADIGRELRMSSTGDANVAACHDLNLYLTLVNQMSMKRPFPI